MKKQTKQQPPTSNWERAKERARMTEAELMAPTSSRKSSQRQTKAQREEQAIRACKQALRALPPSGGKADRAQFAEAIDQVADTDDVALLLKQCGIEGAEAVAGFIFGAITRYTRTLI